MIVLSLSIKETFSQYFFTALFTFAFTAKTAMRVKNCHFWKQEQFVGNGTYNSWQVPQVSFFFWGALKQNQMSSHCNILILKTNIYILHTWAPPRPCPRQSPTYRKFSSSAGLRDSWKEIWWELQKILLSNTHLERQDADEGFLESKVGFKLGHHVLKGGSLKPALSRWSGHHCERQNSQTCFIKHKML